MLYAFCIQSYSQTTHYLWVGETFKCDASSAVMGLTSDISWSQNAGLLEMTGSGFYRDVKATRYFSGTVTVTCTWKYRLYYNDTPTTQRISWTFSCRSNDVSISPTSMTLYVGETGYVGYSHQFNNAYEYAGYPSFSTSSDCISLDRSSGKITALKKGTAYVNVFSNISSVSPYCVVTVKEAQPTGVNITTSASVYEGESKTISATVIPSNTSTTLSWYSNSKSIATVSNGVIYGVSEGTTTVYCVTSNGIRSNNCTVNVSKRIAPTSATISPNPLRLTVGKSKTLNVSLLPSGASSKKITWSSANPSIAKVSTSGTVEGVSVGETTITATADNGITATAIVEILPLPTSISLPSSLELNLGYSQTLAPTFTPLGSEASCSWTSSDTSVATVSAGKVTGKKIGRATITVKTENGKTTSCEIIVKKVAPDLDYRNIKNRIKVLDTLLDRLTKNIDNNEK